MNGVHPRPVNVEESKLRAAIDAAAGYLNRYTMKRRSSSSSGRRQNRGANWVEGKTSKQFIASAITLMSSFCMVIPPARAIESRSTIETKFTDSGVVSTYRGTTTMPQIPQLRTTRAPGPDMPKGYAPLPTGCDESGVGGFEIITPLSSEGPTCVGAARQK